MKKISWENEISVNFVVKYLLFCDATKISLCFQTSQRMLEVELHVWSILVKLSVSIISEKAKKNETAKTFGSQLGRAAKGRWKVIFA